MIDGKLFLEVVGLMTVGVLLWAWVCNRGKADE